MADRHHDVKPASWSPRNPPHPNTVYGKKITYTTELLKRNKYEIGDKYIFKYFLSQFYHWVIILYIKLRASGGRYYAWHWNWFWMHDRFLVSLSLLRFAIARTLFILWSGSTYHTFYKIRCLSVVLRICKSFVIVLSHLSLLCLCGKWNFMYCNVTVTGNR